MVVTCRSIAGAGPDAATPAVVAPQHAAGVRAPPPQPRRVLGSPATPTTGRFVVGNRRHALDLWSCCTAVDGCMGGPHIAAPNARASRPAYPLPGGIRRAARPSRKAGTRCHGSGAGLGRCVRARPDSARVTQGVTIPRLLDDHARWPAAPAVGGAKIRAGARRLSRRRHGSRRGRRAPRCRTDASSPPRSAAGGRLRLHRGAAVQ